MVTETQAAFPSEPTVGNLCTRKKIQHDKILRKRMYHIFFKINICESTDITLQYTHVCIYKKTEQSRCFEPKRPDDFSSGPFCTVTLLILQSHRRPDKDKKTHKHTFTFTHTNRTLSWCFSQQHPAAGGGES